MLPDPRLPGVIDVFVNQISAPVEAKSSRSWRAGSRHPVRYALVDLLCCESLMVRFVLIIPVYVSRIYQSQGKSLRRVVCGAAVELVSDTDFQCSQSKIETHVFGTHRNGFRRKRGPEAAHSFVTHKNGKCCVLRLRATVESRDDETVAIASQQ